jgi:hypothetical protein
MATITSAQSGNWSETSTWVGGALPADGDTVVIDSGHTVTFNVNLSSWTTGINGLTITGTLNVSTSTSSYMFIKAGATINGTGTFNVGTSDNPIPYSTTFTLTGGAGWYIKGDTSTGLTMTVFGTEPTHQWVRFSENEAAAQTELSIDTDLTGEANYWKVGQKVLISTNKGYSEVQAALISSVSSSTITIDTGLSYAKNAGDHIVLLDRNVTILQVATSNLFYAFKDSKLTIGSCAISMQANYTINGCTNPTISGGVFYGNAYNNGQFIFGSNAKFTGGVITGVYRGFYSAGGCEMSGGLICGTNQPTNGASNLRMTGGKIYGNATNDAQISSDGAMLLGGTLEKARDAYSPAIMSNDVYVNGVTFKNAAGIFAGNTRLNIVSATIDNCSYFGYRNANGKVYSATYIGTPPDYSLASYMTSGSIFEVFNYGGTQGAYKAWTGMGVITSQSSVVPSGYSQANQMALNYAMSATYCFYPVLFAVPAGRSVEVEVYLRKSVAMTNLPKVWLSEEIERPEIGDGSEDDVFTMTDSIDTWESDTFTIDNTLGTEEKRMKLTFYVYKQTSGYVYSAHKITDTTPSGGGGAVGIFPDFGKVGL